MYARTHELHGNLEVLDNYTPVDVDMVDMGTVDTDMGHMRDTMGTGDMGDMGDMEDMELVDVLDMPQVMGEMLRLMDM